ncbi:MAG TPA: branched-chain amino acid ABC transporter permease, partial [Rhodoferax sp.]
MMKQRLSIFLLLLTVLAVLPGILSLLGGGYWFRVVTTIGIFAILTMSANLITGTTGLMTLGHAGFYGIGAYTAVLLATQMHWPFYLTLPAAGGLTALMGILLALPTMRLMGIYFAVATLGVGEIIHVSLLNWVDFTRGSMGISAIPGMALSVVF